MPSFAPYVLSRSYERWIAVFAGLAIMIMVLATNMVGDGLRDALDPRFQNR